MKLNNLLYCKNLQISVIVTFLISATIVSMINITEASPTTYFWMSPPEVRGVMPPSGKFLIKINITAAPQTYAWEILLKWNPALLNISYIREGDFLKRGSYSTVLSYVPFDEANEQGEIGVQCMLTAKLPMNEWATGDGWLVNLGFNVTNYGSSVLNLYKTRLWDHLEMEVPVSTYYPNKDCFFSNVEVHDIAVSNVTASSTEVTAGDSLPIDVTVKNEGNFTETFDVAVYADVVVYNMTTEWWPDEIVIGDEITVGMKTVANLASGDTTTLAFTWNTAGVAGGTYTMSAKSLLPDDDTRDNIFIDNPVTVKVPGAPFASFTYSPENPIVGETLTFNASLSSADGGTITNYLWDFETDGNIDINATDPVTYYAFTTSGTYEVTLTIKDDEGLTDSSTEPIIIAKISSIISITVSPTPIVLGSNTNISGSISPVREVTVTIQFRPSGGTWTALTTVATDSYGQYFYTWTPTAGGTYELKASWQGDANTLPSESDVTTLVAKAPPAASFTHTPTAPVVGETVTFTSTSTDSDGSIVSWNWAFGDGTVASGEIVTHTYAAVGDFMVELTVTDNDELTNTEGKQITVGKLNSTITIYVHPATITVSASITVNGTISPTRPGVDVTIQYRPVGQTEWDTLSTVKTDSAGSYVHTWSPQTAGDYQVRAMWLGDEKTLSDESEVETFTVEEASGPPRDTLLYVAAGIAIIIIAGIAIYILKFRKRT